MGISGGNYRAAAKIFTIADAFGNLIEVKVSFVTPKYDVLYISRSKS